MVRELIAVALFTLALALAAQACGPPSAGQSADSPGARATSVRRTAVADVQRIIANNPTATPPPAATETPGPTCQNALWWSEARSHVGESRTLQGSVVATRPAPGGSALLEIGQPYPDPTGLAVVIPSAEAAATLNGKTVCVAGRIGIAEGRPTLQVRDLASIVVVN